ALQWRFSDHPRGVFARFSPDGTRVALAFRDGKVGLLDGENGALLSLRDGHLNQAYWPAFTSDGTRFATTSRDHTVRLWSTETGERVLTQMINPITWSFRSLFGPEDRWLAVTTTGNRIRLYHATDLPARD
ncbi:MAG: WD40 repeat domain-containing protein, partial [Planctomycetota bacterium]